MKYDTKIHKTNNLFLETYNVLSRDCAGWFSFCEADYIAYGDAVNKVFYVIPRKELIERVNSLPVSKAYCGSESEGLLVNINDIKDIIQILKGE